MMKTNILSAQKYIRFIRICATVLTAGALFVSAYANEVGNKNRRANRLFSKGEYEDALRLYEEALEIDPSDSKLMMNRGSALYRLGALEEAEASYHDALSALPSNSKRALADAHYNLGNIQFRQGEQLESIGNAASARQKYSQALENYINTLKLRPGDTDARWNLELAHRKVDLLENMQDQQQDQSGDDDQQEGGQCSLGNQNDQEQQDNQDNNNNDAKNDNNQEQNQQQQQQERQESGMDKEEAERLIEQFADDDEELNRPPQRKGKIRQPERDW